LHPKPIAISGKTTRAKLTGKDEDVVCGLRDAIHRQLQRPVSASPTPLPYRRRHFTSPLSLRTDAPSSINAKQNNLLKKRTRTISGDDVREGLVCVLSVKLPNRAFAIADEGEAGEHGNWTALLRPLFY